MELTDALLAGTAMLLVMEGFMPFLNPNASRRAAATITGLSDRSLRTFGLISMLSGVGLLYLII